MITSEVEYFQQFRGDRNPMPDIPTLLQGLEDIKARRFPKVTEEYIEGRWIVTIHEALGTASPWEGSVASSTHLQTARIEAMIPFAENVARYWEWAESIR